MLLDVLNPDLYAGGDPAENGLPLTQYDYLRDHAPLYRQKIDDPLFLDEAWVVSRYEDTVRILRDPATFTSTRGTTVRRYDPTLPELGGKPAMISMDGESHSRNRRIVNRGFTPAVVRTFEDHFRSLAIEIIERALDTGEVDFVSAVASSLPLYAICDLLGVPESDRTQLLAWTNTLTVPTDPDYAPSEADFSAALNGIWAYGLELAALRRRDPGSDVMSTIVAAADQDQLSDDEVMGFMLTLAAAGNETTRNAISHGLLGLLRHPGEMAWLRSLGGVVPATAVEELLRWSSPVIHSRRTVVRDTELHGVTLRAGEPVVVLYPSANFDPRQFSEPLRLDLRREPNQHLVFATGPHVCLGAHVARLETRIVFEELLRRTERIDLVGPCEYVRDSALRGVKQLPVSLVAASRSRT